ncbi:RnfABCDGE type electron transport complex subunit D [Defluviimonas sp. SAOS-178_SWC]|uniref:RnfABCDGE type electron transport complex subunit D n=1 Tax=Defluviimonas sp. SAOS-178_SWC TaxID=3121287 RepID=UPI003221C8A7
MSGDIGDRTPTLPGVARVTLLQAAALLPPVAAAVVERGNAVLPILAVVLLVSLIWELAFSILRALPLSWHGVTTALILTVIVPPSVPLWQVALAASFGVVIGEMIFGGRGFGFLNAAVASGAFLIFAFPGTALGGNEPSVALAALPGLGLLLATGLLPWRVLGGLVAGAAASLLPDLDLPDPQTAAPLLFGAVFLVADPVATATTRAGRWLTGALAGFLAIQFGLLTGTAMNAVVSAALLGSLAAPLIDHVAVLFHVWRRKRRRAHV